MRKAGQPLTSGLAPGVLTRRVVRHLVLEEDHRAVVPVPADLGLLVVLHEQAVRRHVVAVDDDAGVGGVDRPPTPLPWSARQAQMSSRIVCRC
jgi:hypothetical protein